MKTRFKTKQEFFNTPHSEGGFGVACDYFGEPAREDQLKAFTERAFTTAPHPYEGKSLIIKIQTLRESEEVQEKAIALGYDWDGGYNLKGKARTDIGTNDLLIDKGRLWHSPDDEDISKYRFLTPQQFMGGYMPSEEKTPTTYNRKPDAFVMDHEDGCIILRTEEHERFGENPTQLYKYNIMHANEFFAKHPGEVELNFKEWKVDVSPGRVKVGCESFEKTKLELFSEVMQVLNAHKVDAKDFYVFLYGNKKELDLDF